MAKYRRAFLELGSGEGEEVSYFIFALPPTHSIAPLREGVPLDCR